MGKGFWIGALLGFVVALVVSFVIVTAFDVQSPWTIVIGFLSGTLFTNVGIAIGTSLDDGY